MNGPVRVVVATTEGPSTVLRVTAEDPALRSVVCLGRSTTTLAISRAYDAFVRAPTGVVERAVGHRAFRVDVSTPIDDGDSWQLGLYLAHRLKAAGRLAEDEGPAALVLWASGRVDADLTVQPVDRLDEKLRRSAALFATPGIRIMAVVPVAQAEALAGLPASVESMAVGAIGPILRHLGLDPPLVWKRRRRIGWPWRVAAAAAVLAGAALLVPRPADRPPEPGPPPGPALEAADRLAARPVGAVYPVVHFDAFPVSIMESGSVRNGTAHVALAIDADGRREVLGAWIERNGGAAFWRDVCQDLRGRGLRDALVVLSDRADGFAEAFGEAFPEAVALTGVVGMIRDSAAAFAVKDRRAATAGLKSVYQAASASDAAAALSAFEAGWGGRYPEAVRRWRSDPAALDRLLSVPPVLRALATGTSALDELHRALRRVAEERGTYGSDEALVAALLAEARASGVDGRGVAGWGATSAALRTRFGDRLPPPAP